MNGRWKGALGIPCDRCLKEVTVPFEIEMDDDVDLSPERQEDLADDSYIEENSINTDALLNHEILIRFPMKTLCREDCQGICLKCGKDLNLESAAVTGGPWTRGWLRFRIFLRILRRCDSCPFVQRINLLKEEETAVEQTGR